MKVYSIDIVSSGKFNRNGKVLIIGSKPMNSPYVNIENDLGDLIASITERQMDRIVVGWIAAKNGKRKQKQH